MNVPPNVLGTLLQQGLAQQNETDEAFQLTHQGIDLGFRLSRVGA
jgi:DNA-binding IclR family transcriptional regulator